MANNSALITEGFRITLNVLTPYIVRELRAFFGDSWWEDGIYSRIYDDHKQDYPEKGTDEELSKCIDMMLALKTIDLNWQVFKKKHSKEFRSWVNETLAYRNKWAHQSTEEFKQSECARCLENMSLICSQIDSNAETELQKLVRTIRYGSEQGSQAKKVVVRAIPKAAPVAQNGSALPSWRTVIAPHPDVAEGRYRNAEFAADLSQVARGTASFEYLDPVEFFGRTYVTEGLKTLLVQALQRITGKGGEPVIELKTAFGGGKTHSMLALYHMLSGKITPERVPQLNGVLSEVGISSIPSAKTAVIVGTALNASSFKRPADMPGVQINTVWGEIAYQLAKAAGRPELYDIVKESDKKAVSPGSETLAKLFKEVGPCLILLDELVAYGRCLYGITGLPAGTYENFLSFIQSLTEAACECPNCLIVASIPESDNEIGGETGQKVLDTLTHYFARKEAVWKPVASNEGFEVVRRRLFQKCSDEAKRDAVCEAYFKMYRDNPDKFPATCRDESYLKRMKDCYPIHPEVFDRLYDDWATLEKFQKTRGVLRLMAAVINDLWTTDDPNPLIMPSSISIGTQSIKDELLRYLPGDTWEPIVDSEVDGKKSIPANLDTNPAYNPTSAARRVSRTLFFGSAPSEGVNNRGLTITQILLACGQPNEQLFRYENALTDLLKRLSYLYSTSNNDRFWFDTRPTLRKMMEEKANRVSREHALDEIVSLLKKTNVVSSFSGIHICPATSLDIVDSMEARLVIVSPQYTYGTDSSVREKTEAYILDILANRGTSPRMYKNMLVFSVADSKKLGDSIDEAKRLIAWKEINAERDTKGLNASDIRTVEEGIKSSESTMKARVMQTYCWVLTPSINPEISLKDINLNPKEITVSGSISTSIEKDLVANELLITKYSPIRLLMEMNRFLWQEKNDYPVQDMWKCFCSYCYLPRLTNRRVFDSAINSGLSTKEYFAVADGILDGKYINLRYGSAAVNNDSDILVKPTAAIKQLASEEGDEHQWPDGTTEIPPEPYTPQPSAGPFGTRPTPFGGQQPAATGFPETSFYLQTKVDSTRATRDVGKIVDEIVTHLQNIRGSECKITLEVHVDFPAGSLTPEKKRTIEENCRSLGIDQHDFD